MAFGFLLGCNHLDGDATASSDCTGRGTTTSDLCPWFPMERTPKMTLSLECGRVARVTSPKPSTFSHSGAVVARHRTSYPVAPGTASQASWVTFSSSFTDMRTFAGAAGAAAREANVAAFRRATLAT